MHLPATSRQSASFLSLEKNQRLLWQFPVLRRLGWVVREPRREGSWSILQMEHRLAARKLKNVGHFRPMVRAKRAPLNVVSGLAAQPIRRRGVESECARVLTFRPFPNRTSDTSTFSAMGIPAPSRWSWTTEPAFFFRSIGRTKTRTNGGREWSYKDPTIFRTKLTGCINYRAERSDVSARQMPKHPSRK